MVPGLPRKTLLWFLLIVIVLGAGVFIEAFLYYFIPPSWARFAPDYRRDPTNDIWMGHPRYYFRSDPLLGFDINPLAQANHITLDGWEYQIFANDLGCFDRNSRNDFADSTNEYAYFAGDSFTWGFANYEDKFATVWENAMGILAAKCGVSHTGTTHQFEKFKRVVQSIGRQPKVVFVGFFPNDLINDSAFPHSTVIDGFLVETVFTNKLGQLTREDPDKTYSTVSRQIEAYEENRHQAFLGRQSVWGSTKALIKRYSLMINILSAARMRLVSAYPYSENPPETQKREASKAKRSIYRLLDDSAIRTEFAHSPFAESTKQTMKAWGDHAKVKGYHLVFILIPPRTDFNNADFFDQVKEFLGKQQIDFVDLTLVFKERGWSREDLYWEIDQHLNNEGNRHVGLELSRLGY